MGRTSCSSKRNVRKKRSLFGRGERGIYLMEALISCLVGGFVMSGIYQLMTNSMRYATQSENQILASTMAQQVIDNARDQEYRHLTQDLLGGNQKVSQVVSLYDYPANPSTALFPRPLLRNTAGSSNMAYNSLTNAEQFNGTVTETLISNGNIIGFQSSENSSVTVQVDIAWDDSRGHHTYSTSTQISSHGIHN